MSLLGKWILPLILFFAVNSIIGSVSAGLPLPLPDDPNEQPPVDEVIYSVGSTYVDRFGDDTRVYYPRKGQARLVRLRLLGMRNNINVKAVRLYFSNPSSVREVYELEGTLGSSEVVDALLNGQVATKIEVIAGPAYFWKKPGGYRLDVGAIK